MGQAKTLTTEELERLLDDVAKRRLAIRNRVLLLMSFWSGMRVGEIASLKLRDVVNSKGVVRGEIRLDHTQTKGKHARTVFMPTKLREELQRYVDLRLDQHKDAALFLTAGGKPFSANVLTQFYFWLYRRAGIEASSHSGRRTFITSLATQGVGVRVLAGLAGHRSIAVTQRYIDVNDDMKRRAVELI